MAGSGQGTPISIVTSFVVEDGTGKADANSYVSVAEADTYHANVTQSSDWSAASGSDKENALIVATEYLDAEYQGRWRGGRGSATQALAWPRASVEDDDGFLLSPIEVPQKLKDACAWLALRVVLGDELLGVVTEPGSVTSESFTVGPVTESKTYAGGRPHGYQYPKVEGLLRELLESASRVYRG